MNDDVNRPPSVDESGEDLGALRSPIRPERPSDSEPSPSQSAPETQPIAPPPNNPQTALEDLRTRMEMLSSEFNAGKINHAQFTALYKYYSERRAIIEKLMQRDPETEAWKQVMQARHTTFLRDHFEARPIYYAVFRHHHPQPLITGGKLSSQATTHIVALLRAIETAPNRPPTGLARKAIGEGQWLVLATGAQALTFVIFSLQPSMLQIHLVRDLHTDFERANRILLQRGVLSPQRLVFPQRALIP